MAADTRAGGQSRTILRGDRSAAHTGRRLLETVGRMLKSPLASYHLILGSAGMLLAIGLLMVASSSSYYSEVRYGDEYYVLARQVAWVLIAMPVAWLVSRVKTRTIRRSSVLVFGVALLMLALTYAPGVGAVVNGTQGWLDFGGPFRVQPAEIAKLGLIVWGAHVFARKGKNLRQWKHIAVPFLPAAALVIALVVGQNDLGTSLIIMAIVLAMLWVLGIPTWLFNLAAGASALVGLFFVMSSQNRTTRVLTFLDPFERASDAGFQSIHALYALGSGGWWGRGLGASREKWGRLPEAHTDFIFAILGEELGLMGTVAVLGLFLVLAYAGTRVAMRTRDRFTCLAAAGITAWLVAQALVNLGSVLGLLPVIGVPLPLVSYGGSALMPMLVAVGLLLRFAKEEPGATEALAARRRARRARREEMDVLR
ncbi:MAG TPA: putative lipid II flippase FtsW [Jiangellaceae bacterium]